MKTMCSRARRRWQSQGLLVSLVAVLGGCSDIPVAPPDSVDTRPQGIIEGAVLYTGPRPSCEFDAEGAPVRVPGVLMLTLIDDARPLPPEGTSQEPASFLAIAGDRFFSLDDCAPGPGLADPDDTILRSVAIHWPQIPLAPEAGQVVRYRVAGFYDQRGDFNPFFIVTNATTKGDLSGAAIDDPMAALPQLELVTFGNVVDSPLGERRTGVTVALGGLVRTEPPIFRVVDGPLDADYPVPGATAPDTMQTNLMANSSFTLRLFGQDHGPLATSSDPDDQDLDRVLQILREPTIPGVRPRFQFDLQDPVAYAWYHQVLDLNRDGVPDEHPVLGPVRAPGTPAAEIFRLASPVVLLQRVRTPEEVRAGVPDVGMQAASPNRNRGNYPTMPEVEYPDTQIIVPPIAGLLLNPDVEACQLPYMPPGTPRPYLQSEGMPDSPVECHEIPTGPYTVVVMQGMVAGEIVDDPESETGFSIAGGEFASQVWSVPNTFGDPSEMAELLPEPPEGEMPAIVASQSVAGALHFVDSDPEGPLGRQDDVSEEGQCFDAPGMALIPSGLPDYQRFPIGDECDAGGSPLVDVCCASVRHLCYVPLCPYDACRPGVVSTPREGFGETRRFEYGDACGRRVVDRAYFPECIPFHMPTVCCEGIWAESPRPEALTEPFTTDCD